MRTGKLEEEGESYKMIRGPCFNSFSEKKRMKERKLNAIKLTDTVSILKETISQGTMYRDVSYKALIAHTVYTHINGKL